jgi:hypothetical protein
MMMGICLEGQCSCCLIGRRSPMGPRSYYPDWRPIILQFYGVFLSYGSRVINSPRICISLQEFHKCSWLFRYPEDYR